MGTDARGRKRRRERSSLQSSSPRRSASRSRSRSASASASASRRKRDRHRSRSRSRSNSNSSANAASSSRRHHHRHRSERHKSRKHARRSASRSKSTSRSRSRSRSPSRRSRGHSSSQSKTQAQTRTRDARERERESARKKRSKRRHVEDPDRKEDRDRETERTESERWKAPGQEPSARASKDAERREAPSLDVDVKAATTAEEDDGSRTRNRNRSRSRSRNRSSKRSREQTQARRDDAPPAGASEKTLKSPTSTFKFSGISLKVDKKPKVLLKSPVANGAAAQKEDEKKRRREKLKLWREQQLKQSQIAEESNIMQTFLAEEDAAPKKLLLWSLEDEEKDESPREKKKREQAERELVQKVVEEVDPLDAFMAGLVDEAALQQSVVNPTANVISLEEIQAQSKLNIYGTFLPPQETIERAPVGEKNATEPLQPTETKEEQEAREERELQEFMRAIKEKREREKRAAEEASKSDTGRIYQGYDEDVIGEEAEQIDQRSALEILQDAQKKKEIQPVDHSKIEYITLQKKFYVVPQEIKDATEEEVQQLREKLEIKVRGKNCPRPLEKWSQCGFSVRLLQLIQKHEYAEPFAIQRQALPAIMAGRDVIGIAKTGSGKTLAFLLPMFRHILAQPPLAEGEGPIGLIMAPARELAQQIYVEAKKFAKALGMRTTAVYGGSSMSEQIANLKRGSDIVICTPGRMIDILCLSAGKMVSLKRVSYVVLDEADRMFDMGFEPQITKIMTNIRPDRQTLLFSATFPKAVEILARKVLKKPIEITVGARSTASGDITQYVEVREERDKFMRLLQLLGLWYEKGNILVFVSTQQACDQLFQDLMKAGYPALSLHGGKDQVDRDFTIDDFKRKVRTLMVATSVAGRGLDVKDLVLVINYHCPNHLEDYVHRVGRTGRAGRKGTAYTFISPDEEEYSVDLVKALETAKQIVPPELTALAEGFKDKVRRGEARYHGSGFKGKGFKFDETEKNEAQRTADFQKRQYELSEGIVVEDANDDDEVEETEEVPTEEAPGATALAPVPATAKATPVASESEDTAAVRKAHIIAQILERQYKQSQSSAGGDEESHFEEELEINDYPQQARWKVTQKESTERVAELTGAAVITRGSYFAAGRKPNPGERKLYLAIEGPTEAAVLDAKRELQRILDETTMQVGLGGDRYAKYNL